jgi:hypothetical protein
LDAGIEHLLRALEVFGPDEQPHADRGITEAGLPQDKKNQNFFVS